MEIDLRDYTFESEEANAIADKIWNENAWGVFEKNLSEMYPDGISEDGLEDLFTYDHEAVLKLAEIETKIDY